jgi:hypothetical protein
LEPILEIFESLNCFSRYSRESPHQLKLSPTLRAFVGSDAEAFSSAITNIP